MAATLTLEDGSSYQGKLFGANVDVAGEVGNDLLYQLKFTYLSCAQPFQCHSQQSIIISMKLLFINADK